MARKNSKEQVEEEAETPLVEIDFSDTAEYDYDDWLEFFRKLKGGAAAIIEGIDYIKLNAPPDGYAAARRWLEIFDEPSKMDKLYKGRLSKAKTEEVDIMDVAVGDDDEKFYIALIQQNTAQLNSSSVSQQEVARLTQNINIFRKELRDIRSRKPKEGTLLQKVLDEANKGGAKKAPAKRKAAPKKPKATAAKRSTKAQPKSRTAPKPKAKPAKGKK